MRIAWFAPEKGNSIATYISRILLPELNSEFEIVQYSSFADDPNIFLRFFIDDQKNKFDHVCYFLEDHADLYTYRIHMPLHPGTVFSLSYIMSNGGPEAVGNSGWQVQVDNFKNDKVGLFDPWTEYPQIVPVAARELSFATEIVFFNPYDAGAYLNLNNPVIKDKATNILAIPVMSTDFNISGFEKNVLGYAGYPQTPSRMHVVLESLKNLPDHKLLWMVNESDLQTAKNFAEEFEVSNIEYLVGRNVDNWREIVRRSQILLNPLFSHQENVFPFFQMSVASGKPVIVSDFGFYRSIPDDVVFKLPVGVGEVEFLSKLIIKLSGLDYYNSRQLAYAEEFLPANISKEISLLIRKSVQENRKLVDDYRVFLKKHRELIIRLQLEKCPVLKDVYLELGWL